MTHPYELRALTDVWTGDAGTAQSKQANRLIPTGLLGSIRWWFEVLVRGLGGAPCDPSANQKACLNDQHCAVCELFGCTGWARKFRFDVRDAQGAVITSKLTKNTAFHLRFTPLRAVKPEEWALLELTLRLISDFGALGGKTVLKPSDEQHRQREPHHQDHGLVKLLCPLAATQTREQLQDYVRRWPRRPAVTGTAWASCDHMWFVEGRHLTRRDANGSTFNEFVGRDQRKTCRDCGATHLPPAKCPNTKKHPKRFSDAKPSSASKAWLAGGVGESKKVFSFKTPARTFGFVQQTSELATTRDELRGIWKMPEANDWFFSGDELLSRLFSAKKGLR
ncbi:MAG: type III-B CRISPR module RAMP protein Cmr1 [Polyangiaceae bacterium]|nr:type III-B CRISPR module RAMP protein Cmr1 [Polyangiaceae bacterium]MCW5788850.1 type III-B CRISPR module RAMP protein Cmr1 [Polyangiaceae bacterium]